MGFLHQDVKQEQKLSLETWAGPVSNPGPGGGESAAGKQGVEVEEGRMQEEGWTFLERKCGRGRGSGVACGGPAGLRDDPTPNSIWTVLEKWHQVPETEMPVYELGQVSARSQAHRPRGDE